MLVDTQGEKEKKKKKSQSIINNIMQQCVSKSEITKIKGNI